MQKTPINFDWIRSTGNSMGFFGAAEQGTPVNLPDDFVINLPRDPDVVSGAASGYFPGGQATYTRQIAAPDEWAGKTVLLDIDGAYMNAEVMLNGEKIGYNPYGYTAFISDMTPHLKAGKQNELKVITQNRQPNSRWYSGGGLYREVNVWVGDKYYLHPWSVYVTTPEASAEKAVIRAQIDVTNATADEAAILLSGTISDNKGTKIAAKSVKVKAAANDCTAAELIFVVDSPSLWDAENPNLYSLRCELSANG